MTRTEINQIALQNALHLALNGHLTDDDASETVTFLADEVVKSGISIHTSDDPRTLDDLSAHPLTSVLEGFLHDLFGISEPDSLYLVDEILDVLQRPAVSSDEVLLNVSTTKECELCERMAALTVHHLIPRTEHALLVKRGLFTIHECTSPLRRWSCIMLKLCAGRTRLAMLCRPCHSAVHRAKNTRDLAMEFNTVDKLLELPEVTKFAEWNSKRKVVRTVPQHRKRR